MKADEAFSVLIGRIYDCALDSSLWPNVLAEITQSVNGVSGDLTIVDPLRGTAHLAAFYNWPDDVRELATAHFAISPTMPAAFTEPLMEPRCSSRHLDIEAFHNSRYWKTCFAGRGYYDYLVTGLSRNVSQVASWGVIGGEERGAFGDDDLELARLLSPHIRRSVGITDVLGYQRVKVGTLRAALDTLAAATVIIEPNGRIRFLNAAAQAEMETGSLHTEAKGRLIGQTPEASKLLAEITKTEPSGHQRGRDAILTDASGRTLHVTWASLDQVGEELGTPILIILRQPEAELTLPLSAAHGVYHLTTSETQVLSQVLNGHSLSEAAEIMEVARSTVKSHLDAIYRKTNTHGQTELVRLVMSLASPLHPDTRA